MDQSVEPLRYVRGAVTLSGPIRGLPHTHTLNLFSAAAPPISPPWDGGTWRGCGFVCVLGLVSGWVSLCLAVSQTATGLTGGGSNKPCRTESEYTYYTEMLFEKPMWVWNIEQCKYILVDLNNGNMISTNGHDMGPLKGKIPLDRL